jgi:glycogen debranching enzyme
MLKRFTHNQKPEALTDIYRKGCKVPIMSTRLVESTSDPFTLYRRESDIGIDVYAAGFPGYPANFTRDTLKAGIISGRADLIASQLEISARYQGAKDNQITGERPGKIHHEVPGTQLEGRGERFTTYNACDTTALFLIGTEGLSHLSQADNEGFLVKRKDSLERAVDHIVSLIGEDDSLYWDKPPENSTGYALRVTYWKDSILTRRDGKLEPTYPVTFAQAHFIAARGLLSASRILGRPELESKADTMFRAGIDKFIRPDDFVVYEDSDGPLHQESSDELHSLAYIPVKYAGLLPIKEMRQRAEILATPYGYICTPVEVAKHLSDDYHGAMIWVFEQAMIHYGASKFGLVEEAATAAAIAEHIGEGQELFAILHNDDGTISLMPKGNERQLWSVGATEYYAGKSSLTKNAWL